MQTKESEEVDCLLSFFLNTRDLSISWIIARRTWCHCFVFSPQWIGMFRNNFCETCGSKGDHVEFCVTSIAIEKKPEVFGIFVPVAVGEGGECQKLQETTAHSPTGNQLLSVGCFFLHNN